MQFNALDYIIAALVLLALIRGLRQGLLGVLSGIAGIIAGFILAGIFSHDLAAWLDSGLGITKLLSARLEDALPLAALAPEPVSKLPGLSNLCQEAATFLAGNILEIVSFLLLIIIGSLAVKWIAGGLSQLVSGTLFSHFNRVLGGVLEAVKVVFIMVILLGLIAPSLELGESMGLPAAKSMCGYIDHSVICGICKDIFVWGKDWMSLDA
ncbi:CvpA family protein [Syntrophomonas palmitatica]|uniref:CvpA family protein n=1 Tax=Syntrophomonas palmitatica TaxID=402877 RepID=UPI0006D2C9F5|nr:CvpA family protein [Syntrophomonas palmitatica]